MDILDPTAVKKHKQDSNNPNGSKLRLWVFGCISVSYPMSLTTKKKFESLKNAIKYLICVIKQFFNDVTGFSLRNADLPKIDVRLAHISYKVHLPNVFYLFCYEIR